METAWFGRSTTIIAAEEEYDDEKKDEEESGTVGEVELAVVVVVEGLMDALVVGVVVVVLVTVVWLLLVDEAERHLPQPEPAEGFEVVVVDCCDDEAFEMCLFFTPLSPLCSVSRSDSVRCCCWWWCWG